MADTLQLELDIRRNGLTKKEVAKELGLSEQGFLLKLNNKTEFKTSEIRKMCDLLYLEDNSLFRYAVLPDQCRLFRLPDQRFFITGRNTDSSRVCMCREDHVSDIFQVFAECFEEKLHV